MPLGARVEESGWLNRRAGCHRLRRDGGGEWRLDLGWWQARRAERLLGRRVRVLGTRAGFDLIDVDRIAPLEREDGRS